MPSPSQQHENNDSLSKKSANNQNLKIMKNSLQSDEMSKNKNGSNLNPFDQFQQDEFLEKQEVSHEQVIKNFNSQPEIILISDDEATPSKNTVPPTLDPSVLSNNTKDNNTTGSFAAVVV